MFNEPAIYAFQRTLTANQVLTDVSLIIDRGDFVWTAIWGTQTGIYSVRFGLPSGRKITSSNLRNANMVGTAQFPVVIAPQPIAKNGALVIDVSDLSGASNTIELCFAGYHQFN